MNDIGKAVRQLPTGFEEDRRQEIWVRLTGQGIHGPGGTLGDPNEKKPSPLTIFFYWLIPSLGRPGCRCTHKRCHTWHLHWFRVHPWVEARRIFTAVAAELTKEIDDEILAELRKAQENGN